MKQIIFSFLVLFVSASAMAQPEITTEASGTKVFRGFMSRKDLADTSFSWFASGMRSAAPNPESVKALSAHKDSIHILAFGGTWCDDTKQLLPKVYALADASGLSHDRITLLGVDRDKKTVHHLSEAFNVTLVPTFIILKNGKEVGRVVEYGKFGMPDKEIGDIVAAAFSK